VTGRAQAFELHVEAVVEPVHRRRRARLQVGARRLGARDHEARRRELAVEQARDALPAAGEERGIGTPDQLRAHLRAFEATGVDQVIFIQQAGRNAHADICSSLELFAADVMPEFAADEGERQACKAAELAPFVEAALARKTWMQPLADDDIPVVRASVAKAQTSGTLA